MKENVIKIL